MQTHDFGIPLAPLARGSDAIIIYNTPKSIPDDKEIKQDALYGRTKTSASTALSNCDSLNVIFTDSGHQRGGYNQCFVIAGNSLESYHINRYERDLLPKSNDFDLSSTLKHVPRSNEEFVLPSSRAYSSNNGPVREHWQKILTFVENIDTILNELKVIVDPIVKDNSVIVMTVNRGQSDLLRNFVCAARSRNLDISNTIVFATDSEAEKVAKGMGLTTYVDKFILGHLPEVEAASYGDPIFAEFMTAKIISVLYVSLLGHDVCQQDVDIVWYKSPLPFFLDKSNTDVQKFDILFQDDGNVQTRFAPLSSNSGFYFFRANKKTQYLFTSLLYHAPLVSLTGGHQQVLIQLLQEHSSLFGLKVKVFDKFETDYFPCGWTFFRRKDLMKSLLKGESNSYIYHASWTKNKDDKIKYLKQLGEWYVEDRCQKSLDEIMGSELVDKGALASECCAVEPLITCHYSDLPSKISCKGSPKNDPKSPDFWDE